MKNTSSLETNSDFFLRLKTITQDMALHSHQATFIKERSPGDLEHQAFLWKDFNENLLADAMNFTRSYFKLNPQRYRVLLNLVGEIRNLAKLHPLSAHIDSQKFRIETGRVGPTSDLQDYLCVMENIMTESLQKSSEEFRLLYAFKVKVTLKQLNEYFGFFGVLLTRFSEKTPYHKNHFVRELVLYFLDLPFIERTPSLMVRSFFDLLNQGKV